MNYEELGRRIKAERECAGLGQGELAKRVGRGQQTVSRWEKGASRPSSDDLHRIVEIFNGDTNEWLMLAGYRLLRPVRPLSPSLPLDQLPEETFEGFSRDLVQALNPNVDVHRYGARGHKQDGIDIIAKTEKGLDYQCKRHKDFGPSDVAAAVAATTTEAEHHHLLLARIASPGARTEINKYANWSLWDVDDISGKVRALDLDVALRIVDTYFPAYRKDFLGVDEPSPWLTTEKFYHPLMDRNRIFNHSWAFVGRNKELYALAQFNASNNVRAAVIAGRGGIGKSRLLRAWADETAKSTKVFFLAPGTEVSPKDFEKLTTAKCYLVIDDAHDRSDLQAILGGIARIRPNTRIVISTRPYGLERIRDDLTRSGIGYDDGSVVLLDDLKVEEAETLVVEVMMEAGSDTQYAKRIAQITSDCPLAAVIGGRLVAEGSIGPEVLNNSERFREELLRSFRDIVAGNVGGNDADAVRNLLNFVAMVQPIDTTDPAFQKAAEKVLESKFSKISRDIRSLEDAGVLLRRNRKLRIVPDLLADHIRAEASYDDRAKQPTEYIHAVFAAAKDDLAMNLLVNLSQLDWRLSANEGAQAQLLAKVWTDLETQFKSARIFGRQAMLKALSKVAYYQPEQALTFARLAIENPIDDIEEDAKQFTKGMGVRASYRYVIDEVAPLLRYVAHHQPYLYDALDLLRLLAKQDLRRQNQYPDHPARVLHDLAAIEPGKPLYFNELILEYVLSWIEDDSEVAFDILDQFLITEGYESESQGYTVTLKPFQVNVQAVAGLREKVINAAFVAIESPEAKRAFRALLTLERSLERPRGLAGMAITRKDAAAWGAGMIVTLERLAELVTEKPVNPYMTVQLRGYIAGHARWNKGAVRVAADKVLNAIPSNQENDIARAMADGWGWTFEREGGTMRNEELCAKWRDALANQTILEYEGKFGELIKILETNASIMESLPLQHSADYGPFLGALMRQSAGFTKAVGEHLLSSNLSPIRGAFSIVITALAKDDRSAAIEYSSRAVGTGDVSLARCVSRALGWSLWDLPATEEELDIARELVTSGDVSVRLNLVRIVKRLSDKKHDAISLLTSIRIDDNEDVAEEVLNEFGTHGMFAVTDLSRAQLDCLFEQLVVLDTIDKHGIGTFLSALSAIDPSRVGTLYMNRVEFKEANYSEDDFDNKYKPVPYAHQNGPRLRVSECREYGAMLRSVRDWTAQETGNWIRPHYGAELFKMISAGYDEATLSVLSEWINSGDAKKLEAAVFLLSEASSSFIFTNSDFVIAALDEANKYGKGCLDRVKSSFYSCAISGSRSGTPGQPFPQDVEMREKAYSLMSSLPRGSAGYEFYKILHEAAKANIERHTVDEGDFYES